VIVHTKEEASQKWCPFVPRAGMHQMNLPSDRCITDHCMSWLPGQDRFETLDTVTLPLGQNPDGRISTKAANNVDYGQEFWESMPTVSTGYRQWSKLIKVPTGYCGRIQKNHR